MEAKRSHGRSTRQCKMEMCTRSVEAHDLCTTHARRLRLYGDPLHVKQVQYHGLSLRERLFMRVDTRGDCWEWTGQKDNHGYGKISVHNYPQLAHRMMWQLTYGDIPAGKHILHRCDNPGCVRPEHLFLGDAQANSDDTMQKGRHRYGHQQGEAHGMAKLTDDQIRAIRASELSGKKLAKLYGVSDVTIYDIRNRHIWRHVEDL